MDKPPPPPMKSPRYMSKLEKQLKTQKLPQLRLTMGYAHTPMPAPDNFLKHGEGIKPPRKTHDHKCVKGYLPPVPKRSEMPALPSKRDTNFKVQNIKKVLQMKPCLNYEPKLVDTRDGHVKVLNNSGEIPQFSQMKGFGKIPEYLRRQQLKQIKAMISDGQQAQSVNDICRCISGEERKQLLDNLKTNWQRLQSNFLQLPVITDTPAKILRKSRMEKELAALEKDIRLVEDNPFIYVFDVPNLN